MRKNLLVMLSAIALTASAQHQPAAQWASLLGGTNGDQSTAVTFNKTGNALWLATTASTESAPDIYYNESELCQGALYNAGNSYNNNLSIISTAADGSAAWTIFSTSGDYASGQGNIAVDNDNNVIFTAKVRHTDGMLDRQINVVDAQGNVFEFGGTVDKRYYRLLVAKADASGAILWVKLIDVSNAPAPAAAGNTADFTPDAISSQALTVDAEGNIYIGGNYAAPVTIDDVTLQPENVSTWTGDSQTSCGNMFIIKLDADGNYKASATGIGDIAGYSTVQNLEYADGYVYCGGYARGNGAFTFAGTSLTPSEINSPIIGRLTTSLSADWLKCCPASPVEDKNALQNTGLTVGSDALWLCGMFNQKISDPEDADKYVAATQGKLREGFIVKFDKTTGAWLAAADSREDFPAITKLSGYLKAIQNPQHTDKVYIYGYVMDATIGVFLREYDAETLSPVTDNNWSIVTGGGVPTACAITYDAAAGTAYVSARGNKAFNLMGDITTPATRGWDVLMAKFSLPENLTTEVENITIPDHNDNSVYDLSGRHVGTTDNISSLRPGIYITNRTKILVK